jgi:hypothetical protein
MLLVTAGGSTLVQSLAKASRLDMVSRSWCAITSTGEVLSACPWIGLVLSGT